MKPKHRRVRVIFGYTIFFVGVAGIVLPILPGWPLMIPGLILMGDDNRVTKWVIVRLPSRLRKKLDDAKAKRESETPPEE